MRNRRGTLPVREKGLNAKEREVRYLVFIFRMGRCRTKSGGLDFEEVRIEVLIGIRCTSSSQASASASFLSVVSERQWNLS